MNHRKSNDENGEGISRDGFFAVFCVFVISQLSWPTLYFLEYRREMENSTLVFSAGVLIAFIMVTFIAYPVAPKGKNFNIFFYIFTIFAFTAMVDLDIGITLENLGIPWTNFYLKEGEPYLKSSYGSAINWWDGTTHYILYLYMTWSMVSKRDYRWAGFFWVGSIMNSIIVFLPGNVVGKYGINIKESYLLNVPYALFPIIFAVWEFRKPSPSSLVKNKNYKTGTVTKMVDFLLVVWLAFAICLAFFRALVVLKTPLSFSTWWPKLYEPILLDEAKWPTIQILVHVFYYVPFYVCAINSLLFPQGKTWFPDLAALHAGAALQGQWGYIFPAVHKSYNVVSSYPNQTWVPVPSAGQNIFWVINLSLVVVPVLLFFRACFVQQVYWAHHSVEKVKKS